jgi:hypothetical protein
MKNTIFLTHLSVLGVAFAVASAVADDRTAPPTGDRPTDRDGKVIRPDPKPDTRPDRLTILPPDRVPLPPELRDLMKEFEKAREAILEQEKELLRQLKGATEEDREKIREQLKAKRDEWMERTRELREQIKDRLAELKDKLPKRDELIDAAKEKRDTERKRKGDGK